MHTLLKTSGLGTMYNISPETENESLKSFIGKEVRFKKELLTDEFIKRNGTIILDHTFLIKETQFDYKGDEILRGYAVGHANDFGKPINPEEVEIV